MLVFNYFRTFALALFLPLSFCYSPINPTPITKWTSGHACEKTIAISTAEFESHQGLLKDRLSPGAEVCIRGQDGFEALTFRWQKYRKPNFVIAVAVAVEDDVVETVRYANNHDIPFLAVSGGHGATDALGIPRDGIGIPMQKLNQIVVNSKDNMATIGGGASTFEVSYALWEQGKQTVHGVYECISILGPILGGGHGFLQGQYGSNPDLYWALRGAGHNFGIVTEVVYKVYDVLPGKNRWTSETFILGGNKTKEVFEAANQIVDFQPPDYIHAILILSVPAVDPNEPILQFVALHNGPREQADETSAQIRALGPISETTTEISYLDTPAVWASSRNDPAFKKGSNTTAFLRFPIDLKSYNVDAMQTLYDQFATGIREEPRFNNSFMLVEGYSTQGVKAVAVNSTAVLLREKRLLISSAINFIDDGDEALEQPAISWGQRMRNTLYTGAGAHDMLSYVNYAHSDEGSKAWYGHEAWRQEKLKSLKNIWDPMNRFRYYAPIPLD